MPIFQSFVSHSCFFRTQLSLEHYRDPQFFSSFNLAVVRCHFVLNIIIGAKTFYQLIYAQDTSIQHTILYPGLSYGGWGAGGFWYQGFFNKSASDQPIPRNIAIAWLNYMSLLNQTPNRLELSGSSADGFAAIAGRSDDNNTVQVFLNNYQLDYEIPREILTELASIYLFIKLEAAANNSTSCHIWTHRPWLALQNRAMGVSN